MVRAGGFATDLLCILEKHLHCFVPPLKSEEHGHHIFSGSFRALGFAISQMVIYSLSLAEQENTCIFCLFSIWCKHIHQLIFYFGAITRPGK
jgi:hypothetical protein